MVRPVLWLLPAAAAVVCSLPTLPNPFIFDDVYIFSTLDTWSTDPIRASLDSRDHWYAGRALTYATIAFDRWVWGDWAPGFRLTSIALHALASGAVALCIQRLTGRTAAGVVGGVLFAVHPVHVEAVAQFINRKDILATLFLMPCLMLWLDPARRTSRWVASLAFLGLAFVSKEVVAAGFVPMLILADLLLREDPWPERIRWAAWRSAPFAFAGILAAILLGDRVPSVFSDASVRTSTELALSTYGDVLRASLASVSEQLRLLLFPWKLAADYPVPVTTGWTDPAVVTGIVLLVAWHGAAIFAVRRAPVLAFGMLWPSVVFLPCANVVPLVQFFVAERYLYAPSFGVCLLAGALFVMASDALRSRGFAWGPNLLVAIVALVLVLAGARSALRHRDWRDTETLARSALRQGVESWRIHRMLGNARANAGFFGDAVVSLERAVEIAPNAPLARLDLATALLRAGRVYAAIEAIERAEAIATNEAVSGASRRHLGLALLERDQTEAAVAQFEALLDDPNEQVRALLALAWIRAASNLDWLRDPAEAQRLAERARAGLPKRWRPYADLALGAALASGGDSRAAQERIATASAALTSGVDARTRAQAETLARRIERGHPLRLTGSEIAASMPAL